MADDEHEEVTCPVCGGLVDLEVPSCPHCGAEFEDEGVEEVIEVEEATAPTVVKEEAIFAEVEVETVEDEGDEAEEEVVEVRPARAKPARAKPSREQVAGGPTSIVDFRVIGAALVVLGIIGIQISLFIDWYWDWVPPIEDNLGLFVAVPIVVIVVGILLFIMVKKAVSSERKARSQAPGLSLTVFLVGILALIILAAYKPLNDALQDSQTLVAGMFALLFVVGIVLYMMGAKSASRAYT